MMIDKPVLGAVWIDGAEAAGKLREFRAFSASQRNHLSHTILSMLSQWQSAWNWRGPQDEGGFKLDISGAMEQVREETRRGKWIACKVGDQDAGLKVRWGDGDAELSMHLPVQRLATRLWSPVDERQPSRSEFASGSVALEMAHAMWLDLLQRWALACARPGDIPEQSTESAIRLMEWACPGEFTGTLVVSFWFADLQIWVAMDAASVDAILAKTDGVSTTKLDERFVKRPQLVGLDVALHESTVTLDAYLQPATVLLGELGNLRVGDVIALEHELDRPVQVFSESREKVAEAWLAQTNGFKSLELATPQK